MREVVSAILKKSNDNKYKYVVTVDNGNKKKILRFGDKNYEDYTKHKDDDRKKRYINRHVGKERWWDPYSKGFWSRWLLWNKKTIGDSKKNITERFGIKFKKT